MTDTDRYVSTTADNGAPIVLDTDTGESWPAFNRWSANWEADHRNGKHDEYPHRRCTLCREQVLTDFGEGV